MATSFKGIHACTATLSAPNLLQATADPRLHQTLGHTQASLAQSLVGSLLLSPGSWCTQGSVCALPESVSPVLCKFWQLYGGVNGTSSKRAYAILWVCCTQIPCPCGRPLPTLTSAGDTQAFKGRSGTVSVGSPGAQKVLFEPSKHLWRAWGLILSHPFPSCCDFSLSLDMEYLFLVGYNILLWMVIQQ